MGTSVLVGVLSSLISAVIFSLGVYLLSKKFHKWFFIYANRILGTGITYVYNNQEEACDDIEKSFDASRSVRILTLRGRSFLGDSEKLNFITKKIKDSQELVLLIGDPTPMTGSDYLGIRARELKSIDDQSAASFLQEVGASLEQANAMRTKGRTILLHNSPPVFRLILFDEDLYLSFYSELRRARQGRVYRVPAGSELYRSFARYFDLIQQTAKDPCESGIGSASD